MQGATSRECLDLSGFCENSRSPNGASKLIGSLAGCGAGRPRCSLGKQSMADTADGRSLDYAYEKPERARDRSAKRPLVNNIAGKVLLCTVGFVMLAQLLLCPLAIANRGQHWL